MTQPSIAGTVAVRQQNDPASLIQSRQSDFFKVLPEQLRDPRWIRLAESAVAKTPALQNAARANPASLMQALLKCATLGHEPDGVHFYLVPQKGGVEGWESYKGLHKRIMNSGQYSKVVAQVVYVGEKFVFNPNDDAKPTHEIDYPLRANGAKPLLSYAYAVQHDGSPSAVAVADPAHIAKIRAGKSGPTWNSWDEQMYLKSALKKLEPWVDKSAEDLRSRTRVEVGAPVGEPAAAEAVFDAEIIDDPDTMGLAELPVDAETATVDAEIADADAGAF